MAESFQSQINRLIPCFALVLAGCAVGPDFEAPDLPNIDTYTAATLPIKTIETEGEGGAAQHFVKGADVPSDWWTLFHSKALNEMIEKGIKNNNTLKAAQASLRQAEANYDAAIGSLVPAISIGGSGLRQKVNGASIDNPTSPSVKFNVFNQGVKVSYILDVFGGLRRQVEAAGAQVDFKDYEEKATYITLATSIATTAFSEAALRAQIEATEELVKLLQQNYDIAKKGFDLGGRSKIDILSQETQLYQTQALLPPLQKALGETRTALSVLIGEMPSENNLPTFNLDEIKLPTELPLGIPACLVTQRPDIKAAEALLHAASAQIGVATANFFPQFTITGNYGGSSNFIKNLFKDSANVWSLMGSVLQPVFQGGTLIAQRDASVAAFEQAFAQYSQTVLEAYKNVADVLHALELDAAQLQVETAAEKAATETLNLTQTQYNLGAVSYLNLIIASRQYQLARIGRIQAQASRYSDTAALFHALGGGWWNQKECECLTVEKEGPESAK
jgi:NodT family efflux transporter outer membrane factor (OMF) lipoprotein